MMKAVNKEKDYLQRLRNVRENAFEYIKEQHIQQNSTLGETFTVLLKLLDEEIQGVDYIRKF